MRVERLRGWVAAVLALAPACSGQPTHVLAGQLYETSRDCVDPTASIDIVDGPDPGAPCAATCLVTPIGQNGSGAGVYVTTTCAPYPPLDDTSGAEAACAGALAALARGDVCQADGTSSSPTDAAGDDAAGDDAAGDASAAVQADAGDATVPGDASPE